MRVITVATHAVALIAGVGGGVALAAIPHADAGGLLSFAGSLIGAAVAVAGGAMLVRLEDDFRRRDRYVLMIEALDEAIEKAAELVEHADAIRQDLPMKRSLAAHATRLTHALVRLRAIEKTMPNNDLRLMKARGELSDLAGSQRVMDAAKLADMYNTERPADFRQLADLVTRPLLAAKEILLRR
jgi:hypothetical protein